MEAEGSSLMAEWSTASVLSLVRVLCYFKLLQQQVSPSSVDLEKDKDGLSEALNDRGSPKSKSINKKEKGAQEEEGEGEEEEEGEGEGERGGGGGGGGEGSGTFLLSRCAPERHKCFLVRQLSRYSVHVCVLHMHTHTDTISEMEIIIRPGH